MNYDRYRTRRVRPPKPGSYAEQRRAERRKKILLICVLVAVVGALIGGAYAFRLSTERNYADGLRYLEQKNYAAAEEKFDHSHGYRDANTLSVYCEYAAMYQNKSTYISGEGYLELFTLRYDTQWQRDIDALADRIDRYFRESLKQSVSFSSSKNSSTSSSSSKSSSKNSSKSSSKNSSKSSGKNSSTSSSSSSGETATKQNTGTYKSSSTYNSSHGQTFNHGGGYHSSLRDDYDNPEDLYEDNKDWYEDEDEAWDEYYDD